MDLKNHLSEIHEYYVHKGEQNSAISVEIRPPSQADTSKVDTMQAAINQLKEHASDPYIQSSINRLQTQIDKTLASSSRVTLATGENVSINQTVGTTVDGFRVTHTKAVAINSPLNLGPNVIDGRTPQNVQVSNDPKTLKEYIAQHANIQADRIVQPTPSKPTGFWGVVTTIYDLAADYQKKTSFQAEYVAKVNETITQAARTEYGNTSHAVNVDIAGVEKMVRSANDWADFQAREVQVQTSSRFSEKHDVSDRFGTHSHTTTYKPEVIPSYTPPVIEVPQPDVVTYTKTSFWDNAFGGRHSDR